MTKPTDKSLQTYLSTLLKPKTPEQVKQSNYFFAYIKRSLQQNYLADVDAHEVLDESVLRLIRYMNKHKTEVKSYEAILKRISLNVIREMSRKQKLKQRVDYHTIQHTLSQLLHEIDKKLGQQSNLLDVASLAEYENQRVKIRKSLVSKFPQEYSFLRD
ncbi:hypothetical protein [Crocosphaera sp. XPORK-15E]|uniref:hypothetical protein n=1 Tax=Crocosphaera sp. XPORK-15E TaxID=3110247 RepID=UPI002B1EEA01|nr:hypothetical protein [Crocosphaera sp. XPORK-15E]MEA5533034.1 hypothetical protein [Crocosphaera sp. XPORK-15E]